MSNGLKLCLRFFDEVCNGTNYPAADQLFDAVHIYHDPSNPGTAKGPRGIKDVIGVYHVAMADSHWDIKEMFEAGDRVVARWTGRGTHTANLMGIPATGRRVEIAGIWVFCIRGGKIIESWNCWDTLGMLQQLGIVPPLTPPTLV